MWNIFALADWVLPEQEVQDGKVPVLVQSLDVPSHLRHVYLGNDIQL